MLLLRRCFTDDGGRCAPLPRRRASAEQGAALQLELDATCQLCRSAAACHPRALCSWSRSPAPQRAASAAASAARQRPSRASSSCRCAPSRSPRSCAPAELLHPLAKMDAVLPACGAAAGARTCWPRCAAAAWPAAAARSASAHPSARAAAAAASSRARSAAPARRSAAAAARRAAAAASSAAWALSAAAAARASAARSRATALSSDSLSPAPHPSFTSSNAEGRLPSAGS